MNTAAGVVGGLVLGAAIGYGAATFQRNAHSGSTTSTAQGSDEYVLQLDGTKYRESDLPGEIRGNLYEVKEDAHQRVDGVLSQFALQLAMAKDKNKDAKADALPPFEELVDVKPATEEEMKALFDQNKARLPPDTTYEKIKPEIEKYLKNQKLSEVLKAKNEEFKAKNRLVLLLPTPVAPKVQLELAPYPAKGPTTSANVLVEVADYVCPHCQASQPEVEALLKDMGDKLRFIPVSFSLRPEGLSGTLARGAFCARQQGGDDAFWKYHETAFHTAKEKGWKAADPDSKDPALEVAAATGLDKAKLETCLASPEAAAFVKNTDDSMHKAGVSGTPTFFMNGRKLTMAPGKTLKENVLAGMPAASH